MRACEPCFPETAGTPPPDDPRCGNRPADPRGGGKPPSRLPEALHRGREPRASISRSNRRWRRLLWKRKEQVLLLMVHHIAGDGAPRRPLARESRHRPYAARSEGNAPALTPLPLQYAELYTLWQHRVSAPATKIDSESPIREPIRLLEDRACMACRSN